MDSFNFISHLPLLGPFPAFAALRSQSYTIRNTFGGSTLLRQREKMWGYEGCGRGTPSMDLNQLHTNRKRHGHRHAQRQTERQTDRQGGQTNTYTHFHTNTLEHTFTQTHTHTSTRTHTHKHKHVHTHTQTLEEAVSSSPEAHAFLQGLKFIISTLRFQAFKTWFDDALVVTYGSIAEFKEKLVIWLHQRVHSCVRKNLSTKSFALLD